MFIPTTKKELDSLGWEKCDIIFVSGDAYIDTYFDGCALLGKYLIKHGFRVGKILQMTSTVSAFPNFSGE